MPALIIALIIAITTATGGGAAYASQGTLPGETLYPVKIALEQLQLNLASGDEGKAQTYIELADKRMSEAERAIELGNSSAGETAAEAFVTAVVEANQHLANAAGSGKDVSGLVARLAANVSRHEEILAAIEVRAPAKAKDALTRAAVAAEKGPKRAGTLVLEEPTSSPTASVTPTPSGSPTATVSPSATVVVSPTATATAVATGTVSNTVLITLTQTISNVQLLETDPNVSGQSYEGLIAKLNAAEQAIGREQPEVAARQLDAFLNQLNAFRNAGHISAENYNTLYESYLILVNSLGGSQKPQSAVTPSSHAGGNKTEPISTATARPARPEPTPRGKR